MAKEWAKLSHCTRKQVAALLVKNGVIISDGYNGTPSGFPNTCENDEGETHWYVLHAEANAITKIAKSTNSAEGSTLYVTLSPCFDCAKLIIQAGIKRIVYSEVYRKTDSFKLFEEAGIEIKQMEI
jgi:dCMP deaminase